MFREEYIIMYTVQDYGSFFKTTLLAQLYVMVGMLLMCWIYLKYPDDNGTRRLENDVYFQIQYIWK